MNKYYIIVAVLVLLLTSIFVFNFSIILDKSKIKKNVSEDVAQDMARDIVIDDHTTTLENLDLTTNQISEGNRQFNIDGYYQSVRSYEPVIIGGQTYTYRIDILGRDESPNRVWLTQIEYQSLVDQVISKEIKSGDITLLRINGTNVTIDKRQL